MLCAPKVGCDLAKGIDSLCQRSTATVAGRYFVFVLLVLNH
jgi:hypothetical protein